MFFEPFASVIHGLNQLFISEAVRRINLFGHFRRRPLLEGIKCQRAFGIGVTAAIPFLYRIIHRSAIWRKLGWVRLGRVDDDGVCRQGWQEGFYPLLPEFGVI